MDVSRIPWWLVLLIGISIIALAAWQSSRCQPHLRLGAGGLALIYFALLAFAIGGDPRGIATASSWRIHEYLTIGLGSLSLGAAVLLAGRPSLHAQLIWFGVMSLANAGICVMYCATLIIPLLLLVSALVAMTLLANDIRRGVRVRLTDLWSIAARPDEESPFQSRLAALTGLCLALLLVGTSYYALHDESMRATPSRRHSALPTRARVRAALNIDPAKAVVPDMAGRNLDLLILLAVLGTVTFVTSGIRPSRTQVGIAVCDGERETQRILPREG